MRRIHRMWALVVCLAVVPVAMMLRDLRYQALVQSERREAADRYSAERRRLQVAEREWQEALGAELRSLKDVDLAKAGTLKELRRMLRGDGKQTKDLGNTNTATVSWYESTISANFFLPRACSSQGITPSCEIPETSRPYAITMSTPFEGAIRGFRLSDSPSRLIAAGVEVGGLSANERGVVLDEHAEMIWLGDPVKRLTLRSRGLRRLPASSR
jgi:hypothetical protein